MRHSVLTGLHVGLYERISDDTDQDAEGVQNQARDLERDAGHKGARSWVHYPENDTSAYQKRRVKLNDPLGNEYFSYRVIRPVYHQLLADLRSGKIEAALVHNIDRLARDSRDLEDAIEVVQFYKRPVDAYDGGLDLNTDSGVTTARMLVVMANKASMDSARRQRDSHRHRAEQGIPVGSKRPFGWQEDKRTADPVEVALIQEAVTRIMRGDSVDTIVKSWNARGVPTPMNARWRRTTLVEMLRSPRMVGYRTYKGEILYDPQDAAKPVIGQWDPLLQLDVWEALRAVLQAPRTGTGSSTSKYLLSSFLRCGVDRNGGDICGTRMFGGTTKTKPYYYFCHTSAGGCGNISVKGAEADRIVLEAFFLRYRENTAVRRETALTTWPREAEWQSVLAEIAENAQARADGHLGLAEYLRFRDAAEGRKKALEGPRNEFLAGRAKAAAGPADLEQDWAEMSLERRRQAIGTSIEAIMVRRAAVRGSKIFDPNRLEILWK